MDDFDGMTILIALQLTPIIILLKTGEWRGAAEMRGGGRQEQGVEEGTLTMVLGCFPP